MPHSLSAFIGIRHHCHTERIRACTEINQTLCPTRRHASQCRRIELHAPGANALQGLSIETDIEFAARFDAALLIDTGLRAELSECRIGCMRSARQAQGTDDANDCRD